MIENKSLDSKTKTGFGTSLQSWVKFGVSMGLLVWIIREIPLISIKNSLLNCHWPSLLLAFFIVNLCMFVSVLKWQPLLTVQQIHISFARLLAFYYAGLFANNFLPSSIGGDALRIYDVARDSGKTKEAIASVVMERLMASLALGLTALIAMTFMSKHNNNITVYCTVGGLVILCFILFTILFFYPFKETGRVGRWLYQMGNYKKHPYILVKVLVLSFLFQGFLVIANVFTFQAIGVNLPWMIYFLYIPVIMAVSMIPLSINGLGVREGMYVLLYGYAGLEPATAILGSLLFFTQVTVASLAGGVIILIRNSGGNYGRYLSRGE